MKSIKAATKEEINKEPYNAKNYKPIAKLTTHDLKDDEVGKQIYLRFLAHYKSTNISK